MRIVLVNTAMENSRFRKMGFLGPPYWAAILARKIRDRGHEAVLLDLQFQDPMRMEIKEKYYENADAVFVSGMIPNYPNMMGVSEFYRKKGVKVIFGGWGPTSIYKEFCEDKKILDEHIFRFCDAAVIGEAELSIDEVLNDLEKGGLRQDKVYLGNPEKWDWVMPDFTIWTEKYPLGAIQTQRGCPENCKFCSVTSVLGLKVRAKPVDFVKKELELLWNTHHFDLIFFYDDNIIGKDGGKYARELFTMFKDTFPQISWASQCTTRIINQPDLLDLFAKSRCVLLFFGFESLIQDSLVEVTRKNFNQESDAGREKKYRELVGMLRKRGIETWGSFICGFEHDTEKVFERTLSFALESGILLFQMMFLTPLAGTPLFREAMAKNNLLYPLEPKNWGTYDFFQPTMKEYTPNMSNAVLSHWVDYNYDQFYSRTNVLSRVWNSKIPKSYLRRNLKYVIGGQLRRLFNMSSGPQPQ